MVNTQEFDYDPFGTAVMENPLPFYKELRDNYPVYRLEAYDAWAVSRFQDVWDVLGNENGNFTTTEGTLLSQDQYRTSNGGVVPVASYDPLTVLANTESPVHEELRQAVGAPLRPRAVQRLAEFVRGLARERLDELVPRGRFNLTSEYAGLVSAGKMCYLLGIPGSEAAVILDAVNSSSPGRQDRLTDNENAMRDYGQLVLEAVQRRKDAGANGDVPLIDGLINYRLQGRELQVEEMSFAVLAIILFGGTETLPKVVAHGLMELWRRPDQRREVASAPENFRIACEEMLRYCAPAQWFTRTVKTPVVIGGQELEVGQRIFPLLMAANRDEREFVHPDDFRWDRKIERHLAFGHGQLLCIGHHVARLEGRILIEELMNRVPDYEVDLSGAERWPSTFQWGWTKVPLVVPS